MFGAILKATNSSFQKGITLCRSVYVKKVMKLLAYIFEQPSCNRCSNIHMGLTQGYGNIGLNTVSCVSEHRASTSMHL